MSVVYSKNTVVDYRIGPRETKIETYTWKLPSNSPSGLLKVNATLYYSLVPSSVGRFLKLPDSEYRPKEVNSATITLKIAKK